MPFYEYRCSNCGHELEALQKIAEPVLTTCPDCRQETLVKLVSAAGFQLKGSGWYATDFRNGSKPAPKPDAPSGAPSDSKTEKTTDGAAKAGGTPSENAAASAPSGGCGSGCACH
jgi:putative FmdB family regulatory protein